MAAGPGDASEGVLSTGLPYLKVGSGPPLVVAPGLSPTHANPTGMFRRSILSWAAPFAEHFTVYRVQRRPGLAPGTTMSDIAADYAGAIEHDLGEPAFVHGTSTGGSVGLQLAVDRPDLVRRLVVAAAACRISPYGLAEMAEFSRLVEAGETRRAAGRMVGMMVSPRLAVVARGVGWLAGGRMVPDDPADMLAVISAEDRFDVERRLDRVTAPTLVMGGGADRFYSEDLFRRTADGIADGRAVVFPGKAHGYPASAKEANRLALDFLLGR